MKKYRDKEQGTGNGEQGTGYGWWGNGEWGKGNGESYGMGNVKWGMGNHWECGMWNWNVGKVLGMWNVACGGGSWACGVRVVVSISAKKFGNVECGAWREVLGMWNVEHGVRFQWLDAGPVEGALRGMGLFCVPRTVPWDPGNAGCDLGITGRVPCSVK